MRLPCAYTVGSLQRKSQIDVLLEFIKTLLEYQNPADKLKELAGLVDDVFQLMPSGKHMGCVGGTIKSHQLPWTRDYCVPIVPYPVAWVCEWL